MRPIVVACIVAVAVTACGSGDETPPEQRGDASATVSARRPTVSNADRLATYFDELEFAYAELSERTRAAQTTAPGGTLDSIDELATRTTAELAETALALAQLSAALRSLDPPPSALFVHEQLARFVTDTAETLDVQVDAPADIGQFGQNLGTLALDYRRACEGLLGVAAANDIATEIECPNDE